MKTYTIELTERELIMTVGAVNEVAKSVAKADYPYNVHSILRERYFDLTAKLDMTLIERVGNDVAIPEVVPVPCCEHPQSVHNEYGCLYEVKDGNSFYCTCIIPKQ